ncbi:hypothetical protein [Microbacterium gilvum]|uniref:Alkaline shock response membrane anchor protein AmaP n=1 Tax=Microbacterium gilvum TaxID=1336204 RepID=A0ABP9A4D1_9MICO
MNGTNRALNRAVLALVGLALVGLGGAVIAATTWTAAADVWHDVFTAARVAATDGAAATRIDGTAASWLGIGIVAALAVVAIVLAAVPIRALARRSHVHDGGIAERTDLGRIVVAESFASDALRQSLDRRPDVLSSRVAIRRARGIEVLHVDVTPRRSASPADLASATDRLLANLATLTGERMPAVVTLRSSLRARFAADQGRVD